jgi:hypothetical protein
MRWATKDNPDARENASFRLAVTILIVALAIACSPRDSEPEHEDALAATPTASLFAVGDTGAPWGMAPRLFEGQLAVGVAMQRAHQRLPIDAFVLLGDNFYPNGLQADELLPRIVENVARPYCAFIDPSTELASLLSDACTEVGQARPRIFAVLGNHDLTSPDSLELQRIEVPRFVRNWEIPAVEGPAIRELPGGLSLIFLNSDYPWDAAKAERLAAALQSAKGPWRIIVGHRPPIAGHPQLSQMVAHAAERSGRIVHTYLAGHVHVLSAIRGARPAPALTVIAGSGAHAERQDTTEYRIEEADLVVEELGFLRLDVMGASTPARLRLTLFQTPPSAALAFLGNKTIARYEIGLDGSVLRTD